MKPWLNFLEAGYTQQNAWTWFSVLVLPASATMPTTQPIRLLTQNYNLMHKRRKRVWDFFPKSFEWLDQHADEIDKQSCEAGATD